MVNYSKTDRGIHGPRMRWCAFGVALNWQELLVVFEHEIST